MIRNFDCYYSCGFTLCFHKILKGAASRHPKLRCNALYFWGYQTDSPRFWHTADIKALFCDSLSICKKPCYTVLFLRSALPCDVDCHGNQTWLYPAKKIGACKAPIGGRYTAHLLLRSPCQHRLNLVCSSSHSRSLSRGMMVRP